MVKQFCSYPLKRPYWQPQGSRAHTHLLVKDKGWRWGKSCHGAYTHSQSIQPGRRSCQMWVCINCMVLVLPREPSLPIMIEPVSLRGSGFSSIRVDCHQTPNEWCVPESTIQHAPGRLIGLAFCHHHVRPSNRPSRPQQLSRSSPLWTFAAYICTTGFCVPASNLMVWVHNKTLPVHLPHPARE